MTKDEREEAIRKLEYSKKAYQMLIDEKVDSGKLVGKDVKGEWKVDTPLDEAYKSMIDALNMAIKALEQEPILDKIKAEIELLSNANPSYWHSGDMVEREEVLEIIDKYRDKEQEDNGFFDEIMDDESDGEAYDKIKEIIEQVKEQEE